MYLARLSVSDVDLGPYRVDFKGVIEWSTVNGRDRYTVHHVDELEVYEDLNGELKKISYLSAQFIEKIVALIEDEWLERFLGLYFSRPDLSDKSYESARDLEMIDG